MTDLVEPSFSRTARNRTVAAAIAYSGAVGNSGWVQPSTSRLVEDPEGNLATGALNAFAESHSASSFDVTIDTGEALVEGAYLARDTTTTVTLSSSTTNQDVYVGWKDGQGDTVIIGKSGAFTSSDHKILAWTFDTDGSGVTSATDQRNLDDYRIDSGDVAATKNFASGDTFTGYPIAQSDIGFGASETGWVEDGNSPQSVSGSSATYTLSGDYDKVLVLSDPDNVGYDELQINGDTGTNYTYLDNSDTQTTGASAIPVPRAMHRQLIEIGKIASRGIGVNVGLQEASTSQTVAAENNSIAPPINQFTLKDSSGTSRSETLRVYGWSA